MNNENTQPVTVWRYFQMYRDDKQFEDILKQKGISTSSLQRQHAELERRVIENTATIAPEMRTVECKLNEGLNWEQKTRYVFALAIPEEKYSNAHNRDDYAGEAFKKLTLINYRLGIARLNGNGRTVRMTDPKETYSGKSFEDTTFARVFARREKIVKNKKETKKETYVLYQGVNDNDMQMFGVASTIEKADSMLLERVKFFARLISGKSNMGIVITHPYLTNTPTHTLDL